MLNKKRDSNKEGADAVCGRKQSGGLFLPTWSRSEATRRRTGVRRKNPLLSAKTKSRSQGLLFALAKQKEGFEQGGSRLVCGRKQSGGLFLPTWSRSEATRRRTGVRRKNSLLSAIKPTVILIELRWAFSMPKTA